MSPKRTGRGRGSGNKRAKPPPKFRANENVLLELILHVPADRMPLVAPTPTGTRAPGKITVRCPVRTSVRAERPGRGYQLAPGVGRNPGLLPSPHSRLATGLKQPGQPRWAPQRLRESS